MSTPLDRARAKLEQIERELTKYPEFHLFLLAKTREERRCVEALLIAIPAFDLWRKLYTSISATSDLSVSSTGPCPQSTV